MCGIWGISDMDSGARPELILKMIQKLMVLSEVRGKDASGIAVMCEEKLNIFRKAKSSHELLKDGEFKKYLQKNILEKSGKSIWIAGHSRMVTNGTQYNPNNNQPVAKKHIALVHNGIIVNESELWEHLQNVVKESEVDSESILETFRDRLEITGDVKNALADTYGAIQGMASTIWLIQKGHYMIAASNNGSLYQCTSPDGKLSIFASERLMLEKLIHDIRDASYWLKKKKIVQIPLKKAVILSDGYRGNCNEICVVQDLPVVQGRKY